MKFQNQRNLPSEASLLRFVQNFFFAMLIWSLFRYSFFSFILSFECLFFFTNSTFTLISYLVVARIVFFQLARVFFCVQMLVWSFFSNSFFSFSFSYECLFLFTNGTVVNQISYLAVASIALFQLPLVLFCVQITDPPVSVYKGYSLPKDAEEYLFSSRGLHNALYTIKASDLNDDLFGTLVPCPFQEPAIASCEISSVDLPQKRPREELGPTDMGDVRLLLTSSVPLSKLPKSVHVLPDTLLGLWKIKNANMSTLHAEAGKLKEQYSSFKIAHVLRKLNSDADADAQANFGDSLAGGFLFALSCSTTTTTRYLNPVT